MSTKINNIVLLASLVFFLTACGQPARREVVLVPQGQKKIINEQYQKGRAGKRAAADKMPELKAKVKKTAVAPAIPVLHREKQKRVELVVIGGREYSVPKVWRGWKITEPSPSREMLMQIPGRYTRKGMAVFLEKDACEVFVQMAEAAEKDGIHLQVDSGFRSAWYQRKIFEKKMAQGRTWDDVVRYVAPPGYSEHALGTVVDLCPSNSAFASTETYRWMQENAAAYHFYETYPESSPYGFPWESWHWRYHPERKE